MSQSTVQQYLSLRRQERCEEASLYAALQLYKATAQGWKGIYILHCLRVQNPPDVYKNAWQSSSDYIEASASEQEIGLTALAAYSALKQQVNYRSLWPAT